MKDFRAILTSIEKHKDLIEDIKSGIYFWRLSDNFFIPSTHLLNSLGYTDHDSFYNYETWRKIWHPDDKPVIDSIRKSAINLHEREYHLIHRLINKSGEYDWFRTDALIVYDGLNPVYIIGSTNNYDRFQNRINQLEVDKDNYKEYLSATDAGTWIWHIETGETIFSEIWANNLGYKLEEIQPTSFDTWFNLIHPEDKQKVFEALENTLSEDLPYRIELRMLHKNGSYVWIDYRGKVVTYSQDKRPLIMVGTQINIDKQKKLELKLRENEFKYKQLVESSYDVIYMLDGIGKCIFISLAFKNLLGYELDYIINQPIMKVIIEKDTSELKRFFESVKNSTSRKELKFFSVKHADGSTRHFKTNAISIRNDQNEFIGFAGTATDITDEVLLEDQLSVERGLFKKTLLSVSDGVISTNSEGIIQIINPSAQKLTGYLEKEAIGKPLDSIYHVENYESDLNDPFRLKRMFTKEIYLVKKNGKYIPIEENISPIYDIDGNLDGNVYVFKDISDQLKQAKDIEYLSYHDYLTGLYNRRFMENALKNFDQKMFYPLGIVMLDVNDLKEMNDEFGHHQGDKLLQLVSKSISESVNEDDLVGRIGGDEFIIISPNCSKSKLRNLKDSLRAKFMSLELNQRPVRVAMGCSIKETEEESIFDVQKKADDLMYINKQAIRFNLK